VTGCVMACGREVGGVVGVGESGPAHLQGSRHGGEGSRWEAPGLGEGCDINDA
jgi:hypothetical protein